MKRLLLIITILFSVSVSAQSLYIQPYTGDTFNNENVVTIEVNRTLYGITIDRNFQGLPDELKDKIINYLKNTNRSEFKGLGSIRFPVVKRSGAYYVVINDSYRKFDPL